MVRAPVQGVELVIPLLDILAAWLFARIIRYWSWRSKREPQFVKPFEQQPLIGIAVVSLDEVLDPCSCRDCSEAELREASE